MEFKFLSSEQLSIRSWTRIPRDEFCRVSFSEKPFCQFFREIRITFISLRRVHLCWEVVTEGHFTDQDHNFFSGEKRKESVAKLESSILLRND